MGLTGEIGATGDGPRSSSFHHKEIAMILIIGATGQTGGAAAKSLVAAGQKVRAAVRNPAKAEGLRQLGIEVIQADAEDPDTLRPALEGVDKVLLATTSDERVPEVQRKAIDTAKAAGVGHIAKISALAATTDSPVRLLRVHGVADEYLRNSGVAYTLIQPVFFMQNLLMSAGTIAAQNAIIMPTGNGKMAQIDVRDIGTFAATVLSQPGHENKTYLISSRDSVSAAEGAERLSLAIGRKIQFISPDPQEYKKALLGYGVPEWNAQGLIELYAMVARGGGDVVTDTFTEITGKEPIGFDQFARDHAQVFLQTAATA
jgi:uncharacterized protein YbjT (DUF2867 family)